MYSKRSLAFLAFLTLSSLFSYLVTEARFRASAQETVSVTIVEYEFRPANITIPVGSTVIWTNTGNECHTATSDTEVWGSNCLRKGESFSLTFNEPGTFTYHCLPHPWMMGRIDVISLTTTTSTTTTTTTTTLPATTTTTTSTTTTTLPTETTTTTTTLPGGAVAIDASLLVIGAILIAAAVIFTLAFRRLP